MKRRRVGEGSSGKRFSLFLHPVSLFTSFPLSNPSHTPSPPPHLAPHTVQAACQHQSRVKVNPICSVTAYAGPRYDPSEPERNLSEPLPEPNRHLNLLSNPDLACRIPTQDNSALIRVEARWSLEEGLCLSPGKTLTSQLKTSPPEIMSQSDASQQQQQSKRTRTSRDNGMLSMAFIEDLRL
ncbi:unnamed protein product [Pleuronectes platessa]|uniref:Uncharacterized protein n=1 Tax=Pleuronectes platessa TaxID=8262 RepID=A0A9N7YRR4_PLEPL|nr:unnamed protein product [Pleuronectes platessa]